jgi:phospholipid transport system substrate-binding protein
MGFMGVVQIPRRCLLRALSATVIALAFAGALSGRGMAAGEDPQTVVRTVGTQGLAMVGPNTPPAQRTAGLRQLFATYFDSGHIAAFALGRYRSIATPQQQEEYFRLYEDYTAASYGAQLAQVGTAPFQVTGSHAQGAETIVNSQIIRSGGSAVSIDWTVVNRHGKNKITDVNIGGSSMKVTQRNEFAQWIENNGGRFDALLAVLRQQITANSR